MFSSFSIFLISSLFIYSKAKISDLRACGDPHCESLISFGRTTQRYNRKEEGVLSFKVDEIVAIYSKEAGTNLDLWGGEINGKSGYIPRKFVKEEKVFIKSSELKHVVPTLNISSHKPEDHKSDDITKENSDSASSNSKQENINSANTDIDSNNENNIFSDEVSLSLEDAEFAALKALSSKGEGETLDPFHKNDGEDIKLENMNDKGSQEATISGKDELQVSVDNPEGSQALNNKIESHVPIINKEGTDVPVNKDGSEVLTGNVDGSQVSINKEFQVPIENERSQISTDNVEGPQVSIDNKEEFHASTINNEDSQILNTGQSSEKKEKKVEKLIPLENKEKSYLELTNKDSKIEEEEMGNNEGNGNEGEDNGSEYIGDWSSENNIESPVDSSSTQPVVDNIPEPSLGQEEIEEKETSPSTESSSSVPPASVTDAKLSKLSKETETVVSDKSLPDSQILEPTPSQIEVVDGTTIVLDGPDSYQPSGISEHEVTHSNLESSSHKQVNPIIENTTPTPHLPNGIPLTQPPLLLQNSKIVTDSMAQRNSEKNTLPVGEETKILPEEPSESKSHLQNENIAIEEINKDSSNLEQLSEKEEENPTVEFSTPKPATVLEQSVKDEIEIKEQSKIESIDDTQSDKLEKEAEFNEEINNLLTEEDSQVSSNMLESTFSKNINNDIEGSLEKDNDQQQIVEDESLNSVEDETVLPSETEDNDSENTNSEGILSSISNMLGYHQSGSDKESKEEVGKEEDSSEKRQEYSEEESKSEDIIETSSDNSSVTSDFTMNSIPFIDPFPEPEVALKEGANSQNSVDEKPSDLSPTDESEDVDFSSSIKKKLLHVSEAVLSEGMALAIEGELADPHLSMGTVTFLLVVAGTIVVLYVSHMIIVKMSRESPILESLNKLDRNHRVTLEENKTLKRQLTDSNGQIKSAMVTDPVALHKLKQQFEETKKKLMEEAEEVRERNQQLEGDLEASTANEVELHRMLDELLANQKETTNFEDSVNSLQLMLESQREVVDNLTSDLALKTRLNEELRIELKDSKSKLSKLEYQIEQLSQSLEEVNRLKQELTKKLASEEENSLSLREMNNTLRQEADKVSKESDARYEETQKLLKDIRKLKQLLHSKETECQISKECVKRLQIFSDSGGNDVLAKLSEVFKIIEVKTELESIQFERTSIQAQLEEKENIVSLQSEDLKKMENENIILKSSSEKLQKERDEATSKLEILSKYYEEKEAQLKKALESQEDLLHSAEGSANLVSNRIQTYELELTSCRSQNESLKNELEAQKQSYKVQLSNEEKKLHETWLSARAAERRQEELRQENTQLRQSLTQLQRDAESKTMFNKPPPKRVDANGSISSPIPVENNINIPHPPLDMDGTMPHLPPPPMMFPPPPGLPPLPPRMFGHPLPPPPPHHPLPDRRLPPAGRIASPPGYDRRSYSPESDRSRYSDHRYSPSAFLSNNQRGLSPDRRSDHMRRNIRRETRRSPSLERHSPHRERWYNHSPTGGPPPKNHRTPPMDYFDSPSTQERRRGNPTKGKKTSTPLGPNDR